MIFNTTMINLLPPQLKAERKFSRILNQVIFGVAILIILTAIWIIALYKYDQGVKADLANAQQKVTEQKNKQKTFSVLEGKIEAANTKLDYLNTASKDRILWSQILSLIGTAVSKNMQVKNLAMSKDTGIISLSGVAANRTDIATTKEKLETLPQFQNVNFQSSSYNSVTNDYNFSLTFEIRKP